MNKSVFYHLSYGVYLVSAYDAAQNRHTGCVANSIIQVTSEPATVAVSINHDNYTNHCIKDTGRLAVSILPETAPPSLIGAFGFASGRDVDKFATTPHTVLDSLAVPDAAMAFLTAQVIDSMETATHTVFLAQVNESDVLQSAIPMTYAYYHSVIKGKTPQNAPTYRTPEETPTAKGWVCKICSYEYTGDTPFANLGNDYVCPICGAAKDQFEES